MDKAEVEEGIKLGVVRDAMRAMVVSKFPTVVPVEITKEFGLFICPARIAVIAKDN